MSSQGTDTDRNRGGGSSSNGGGTAALLTHQNLLRLALKRPTEWQWELTTSSSSPNIHFPRIQLYDGASGELMVEVDRPDCVIRSAGPPNPDPDTDQAPVAGRGSYRRSRTTLVKERLVTSGDSLADIFNQLRSKGLGHKLSTSGSQYRLLQKSQSTSVVVAPSQELPSECTIPHGRRSRRRSTASRSSSILGRISEFYAHPGSRSRSSSSSSCSSSTTTTTATTCSMQQEVEQHRKTSPTPAAAAAAAAAAVPPSILILPPEELPSAAHGVTIEEVVDEPPRPTAPPELASPAAATRPKIYKLVRSNAGTLMVREESFHTQRSLRRRQRQQAGLAPASPTPPPPPPPPPPAPAPASLLGDCEPSRYEPAINHIDRLLSQVMLRSQDLPEDRPERRSVRSGSPAPSTSHRGRRRRRRRRSASVTPGSGSPVRRTTTPLGPVVRRSSSSSPAPSATVGAPTTVRRSSRTPRHQRRQRSSSREPGTAGLMHGTYRAHGHASEARAGPDHDGARPSIGRRSGSVRSIASIADLPPTIAVSALAVNGSSSGSSSSTSSSSTISNRQPSARQLVKQSASACISVPGSPSSGFVSLGPDRSSSETAPAGATEAAASVERLRESAAHLVSSIKSHRSTAEPRGEQANRRTMQRPKPTHGHKRSYSCVGGSGGDGAPGAPAAPGQPSTTSSSASSTSSSRSHSFAEIVELARKPPTGGPAPTTVTETFRRPAPPPPPPSLPKPSVPAGDGEERPPSYAEAVRGGATAPPPTDTQRAAELSSDTRRRWKYYARKHHRTAYQDTP
ncbi:serine/arginine repetitive matrix protein 2 [Anopheles aquasalis]|uniref:serine/arginine repetitive matrix protein 2 n=1 Tax=Anopheles aquasalis TaxID=42839 RepID=UPI00215A5181|nr:serine/arginine repetitive matrix protein 2 [Anopheles aquasalis]